MRFKTFLAPILFLITPHSIGMTFEVSNGNQVENEAALVITSSRKGSENIFRKAILMTPNEEYSAVTCTEIGLEEALDYVKTLRENEQEREEENSRS